MSVSLSGVCSTHSGYCAGEGIRVDIQIPVHLGNLLGGQKPCTQIKVEKLNVCSRCNKTPVFTQATVLVEASELTSRILSIMAIYWEASSHAPR